MRMGVHRDSLAGSFAAAEDVWLYTPADLGWDVSAILAALGGRGHGRSDVGELAKDLAQTLRPGDHAVIMSNGGFGGLHGKLLTELGRRSVGPKSATPL
jgi:UDP-N-acetylmuramate: L-alanyl-gamma-D-glutamyl-meso-diaminopimelate ligase